MKGKLCQTMNIKKHKELTASYREKLKRLDPAIDEQNKLGSRHNDIIKELGRGPNFDFLLRIQ